MTYCKGRPSGTTLADEKHIYVCESRVDPVTRRISVIELAHSLHSICMKHNAFMEFASKMKIKKDYRVASSSTSKQGSSSGLPALDDPVVVVDSDSD